MKRVWLLAFGACGGVSGTFDVSLVEPPGTTFLETQLQSIRITLTDPRQAYDITRSGSGTFDLAFDADATGSDGQFIVQGFDAGGNLLVDGESPPIPIAAIDATIKIYVAPPNTVTPALSGITARTGTTAFELPFGAGVAGGITTVTDPTTMQSIAVTPLEVYNAFDHSVKEAAVLPNALRTGLSVAVSASGLVDLFGGADETGAETGTLFQFDPTQPPAGTYTMLATQSQFARIGALALPIGSDDFVIASGTTMAGGAPPAPIELSAGDGTLSALTGVDSLGSFGASVVASDDVVTAVFIDPMKIVRFHGDAIDQPTIAEAQRTAVAVTGAPNGQLVVVGGATVAEPTGSLSLVSIDGAAGTSTVSTCPAECLPSARFAPAVAATSRYLLVAGGNSDGQACTQAHPCLPIDTADLFDATTLAFIKTIPLTVPRTGATALPLQNDQILIVGGTDGMGTPLGAVELFTPDLPADF